MTCIPPTYRTSLGVLALLLSTLAGCKGPEQLTVAGTVVGSPQMNSGGNAAVVRVYQLSGDANFQRSTVESFWRNDEEALGRELLAPKQEFVVYPNEQKSFTLDLMDGAAFVGFAADLRNPNANQWRVLYPAPDLRKRSVTVTVEDNRLVVATN